MDFVDSLTDAQMGEALRQSHPFWGGKQSMTARRATLRKQLAMSGPSLLRMQGLVDEAGEVVCSMKRYGLGLSYAGESIPTLGIGAVFAREDRRRLGLAREMLRTALERARSGGCGAALLFSDIDPDYYRKLGFVSFPALVWRGEITCLPAEAPLETRVASASDLPRMLQWYEGSFAPDTLRVARSKESWKLLREKNEAQPDLILSMDGQEVGYLSVSLSDGKLCVDEFAIPNELCANMWATVRKLAIASRKTEFSGWIRPDCVPEGCQCEVRDKAVPMVVGLDGRLDPAAIPQGKAHFGSLDHF